MPGVFNFSVDEAVKEAREVQSLGVPHSPGGRLPLRVHVARALRRREGCAAVVGRGGGYTSD
jgi:hypothetical protein